MNLRNIAYEPCEKQNTVSFKIKCDCGCKQFYLYKRILDNKDRKDKEQYETLLKKYNGSSYSDKEGNLWLCSKSFWGFKRKKIKLTRSEFKELISYDRKIIKVRCVSCEKEHILFDSKYNGYDAVVDLLEEKSDIEKKLLFKLFSKDVVSCEIILRNTVGYEEFMEEFKGVGTFEMYTNAFSDIKIIAIKDGKKKTVFTAETQ